MDFDSPWKEALDAYFEAFVRLALPDLHAAVDWSREPEALDQELQQIAPEGETGRLAIDKLVRVWLLDGTDRWILIHVEVQTSRASGFPRRMEVYHHRILDKYNREVVSIAVLADDSPSWRPDRIAWSAFGCSREFVYPVLKPLDFAGREAELEASDNPFAKVVLAHLTTIRLRGDAPSRLEWKWRIVRGLFEQGWPAEDIRRLFRFVDWLIELPDEFKEEFWDRVDAYQKEKTMPFVTQTEQLWLDRGEARGVRKGMLEVVSRWLADKFGEAGRQLADERKAEATPDILNRVSDALVAGESLDRIRDLWPAPPTA